MRRLGSPRALVGGSSGGKRPRHLRIYICVGCINFNLKQLVKWNHAFYFYFSPIFLIRTCSPVLFELNNWISFRIVVLTTGIYQALPIVFLENYFLLIFNI